MENTNVENKIEFKKIKRDTAIHQETFETLVDISEYLSNFECQPLKIDIQFVGVNRGYALEVVYNVD